MMKKLKGLEITKAFSEELKEYIDDLRCKEIRKKKQKMGKKLEAWIEEF